MRLIDRQHFKLFWGIPGKWICRRENLNEFEYLIKECQIEREIGLEFCRLLLIDCLFTGTGTFGRVVLCEHTKNTSREHPFYAMKMLRVADVFRLKQVEHIKDERAILAQLNHPFIVRL